MKETAESYRALTIEDLLVKIKDLKTELLTLRQQKNLGTLKGNEIKHARKNVARAMTVLTEKRTDEAIEKYKDAKILPKDMRQRLTRSMRLKLTKKQENKKVWKVRVREMKYPKVYFSYVEDN